MKRSRLLLFLSLFFLLNVHISAQMDIQGHRGCRGLMPENTIPAMLHAIDLGVQTLEFDVVITGDREVLVSHEPWMSHKICLDKDGKALRRQDELSYHNIYNMSLFEAQKYDCGSTVNPDFPEQKNIKLSKPEFYELIQTCEEYVRSKRGKPIYYNIEIKSTAEGEGIFHPEVDEFCQIVVFALEGVLPWERVTIQSFDTRALKYIHKKYPAIRLAYLLESWNVSLLEDEITALGFTPQILSPYFRILDESIVKKAHELNMKVIPWTINTAEDMESMADMGVDGIITDYPDRALELFDKYNDWEKE
jgi:glycerophosphoryl diester phosphodiesterase